VRHPNVAVIHGVDVHDGKTGLWSDLVHGTTLEERLHAHGPVGVEEACHAGIELCRALAAVHAAGIVHGDVKAANVLRETGGRLVLTDFGAASDPDEAAQHPACGTPLVMAPELFAGGAPSPASDIYALGVLLFRLVTGRYPIEAENIDDLRAQHERASSLPFARIDADLPAAFREILDQMLAPHPHTRIDNARTLEGLLIATVSTLRAHAGDDVSSARPAAAERLSRDRLLGREAELGSLRSEFRRTSVAAGYPVIVSGEPGAGKTLLARTFQHWVEAEGGLALYTRFYQEDAGWHAPYQPFLDLLADTDDDNPSTRQTSPFPDAAQTTPQAIGRAFVRLSRARPLVLILDDLQWTDECCRDVVGHLMRCSDGEKLMLLALCRSDVLEQSEHPMAQWLGRQADHRRFTALSLDPFDEVRVSAVVQALAPGPAGTCDIPHREIEHLHELSGGNPYFLVELLKLLETRGMLVWEPQPLPGWRWRDSEQRPLPGTLVLATRAKLAALPEPSLDVLRGAAILGDEFRLDTLATLSSLQAPLLEAALDDGVRNALLTRRGLSRDCDYGFRHSLVRQVVLQDMQPQHRRRLHAAAANALLATCPEPEAAFAAALSGHYDAAGDAAQTLRWSLVAWQEARLRGQWSAAMTLLVRADKALQRSGQTTVATRQHIDVLLGDAEAAWHLGRLKRSQDCADAAVTLARRAGARDLEAGAMLQQARTAIALGHYCVADLVASRAAELYDALADANGSAQAQLQRAAAGIAMGRYRETASVLQRFIACTRDGATLDAARGLLGWALALQGHCREAMPLLRLAIARAERTGDLREMAVRLRWLHWAHLSVGEYEAAYELARQAYERARCADDAYDEAKAIMGMGQARLGQGLCGEAMAYLRRTLEKLSQMGAPHREAETLWLLGRAHAECGQFETARNLLERALAMVREVGDRDDEFRFLVDLSRVALLTGRPGSALESITRAAAIAAELGSHDGLGLCHVEKADALTALERTREAASEARAAVAALEATGSAERWRAHWSLARATESVDARAVAVPALRCAVSLLDNIRQQIPPDDVLRRREVTLLRCGPARDLVNLLTGLGQDDEAGQVARSWELSWQKRTQRSG
jgi:tetratricopeptide (TPR) repeat protein